MKILFLVKFYPPFDRGGSEWSVHDLASLLIREGHDITIVTPNYGAKSKETINGIKVARLPFPIKLKSPKSQIAPYWTNNIIWFIYSSFFCLVQTIKNQYQAIHVHSNEFLPAAFLTSKILRIKTVASFRDYQTICNFSFCLWRRDQKCHFREYFQKDFQFFYENYVDDKNLVKYYLLKLAALRAWIMQKILLFFAKRIDSKVAISEKVAQTFKTNGIQDLKVIYNPVIVPQFTARKAPNKIVYVGKLSKGKGVDILLLAFAKIVPKIKDVSLEIIGTGHLYKSLTDFTRVSKLKNKIVFRGYLNHSKTLEKIAKSSLTIIPSIWPEPFGRVAIESLLVGTPVLVTNRGGLPEIVRDNRWGIVVKPTKDAISAGIERAIKQNETLKKHIKDDLGNLETKFTRKVVEAYLEIYEKLIK